jgi:hypothetical protein
MKERQIPEDYRIAQQIACIADELKWCLAEQYTVDGDMVLRGGNEVVSFYCRPNSEQAARMARGLEQIIGPVRRENALKFLSQLRALSEQVIRLLWEQEKQNIMSTDNG